MNKNKLWTKDFCIHTLSYFFMGLGFYFLLPALPQYITDVLHKSEGQVGLIMGSYAIAALFIRPFAGFAFDFYGRKTLYLFSLAMFTLVIFSYELASSMFILLIIRLFHGLSWGILTTGGATVATDLLPAKRRGEGIGFFGLSFTLAMAIGPLIGIWLLKQTNFSTLFIYAGIAGLVSFALAIFTNYPKNAQVGVKVSLRSMFEKKALHVSIIMLFIGLLYAAILSFVTLYAEELNITRTADFFLLFAAGITVTRPLAGTIMDKEGPEKIMFISFIIASLGLALLSFQPGYIQFLISAFIIGFGLGVHVPVLMAMMMNMVPVERRGAANSTFYSAIDLGFGFGAFALGFLAELTSLGIMYRFCAAFILIPAVYFFSVTIKHYQKNVIFEQ